MPLAYPWVQDLNPFGNGGLTNAFAEGPGLGVNGSRIVAVGYNSNASIAVIYSDDWGATWTAAVTPFDDVNGCYDVIWSDDDAQFVIVGQLGAFSAATSPDGITWTQQSTPDAFYLLKLDYSPTDVAYIASGAEAGGDTIFVSTDGAVTWAHLTTGSAVDGSSVNDVYWDATLAAWFVGNSTGAEALWTSTDIGATWTAVPTPLDGGTVMSVCHQTAPLDQLVIGGFSGGGNFARSLDGGTTWTVVTQPSMPFVNAVADANGVLLAGGDPVGPGSCIASSDDGGVTWVDDVSPFDDATSYVLTLYWAPVAGTALAGGDGGTVVNGQFVTIASAGPTPPVIVTQYQRIYGWTVNISDDALETIDPVLTSPQGF